MSDSLKLDQHISHRFTEELEDVRTSLLEMGGRVEEQSRKALEALVKGDFDLAMEVASSDHLVDEMEIAINAKCTDILALRQPAASDLRIVVAVIRMTADLERIGDEAEKIGRFACSLLEGRDTCQYRDDPKHLGKQALEMLRGALDAFARLDVRAAVETASRDPELDREFESVTRLLVTHMMEQPAAARSLLKVNWCARALERIGDHAANICEEVIFLVEGSDVRHMSLLEIRERYL